MDVLLNLNIVRNSQELQNYISNNDILIFDSLSQINHSELLKNKKEFRKLSLKANLFSELDYSISGNVAVINAILSTAIRFGDNFLFEIFFRILKEKGLYISNLLHASSFYLIEGRTSEAILACADEIHERLEQAYIEEEDNNKNVIASLLHYYQFFIKNFLEFALDEVLKVNLKLKELKDAKTFIFNQNEIIDEVLDIELSIESNPLEHIYNLIDSFLGRLDILPTKKGIYLLEKNTPYCDALGQGPYTLNEIIIANKAIYSPIKDDHVFWSLHRGVKIPEEEIQLNCYLYAYGDMHRAKLDDALSYFPYNAGNHRVIDWGCGQGIGSLIYLEKLENAKLHNTCEEVILIEPSPIALQRASFHIQKRAKTITTCNLDFDSLTKNDFNHSKGKTTVHVFSNVLDVELFSLNHIVELIKENCTGVNHFIISSPNIDITRVSRLDTFVNQFSKNNGFQIHYISDAQKGQWKCGWTKSIRVFQAEIN